MYCQRRKFKLSTSHPDIVSLSAHELSVPALDHRNIGLQIKATSPKSGAVDAFIFINDEDDRAEECYRVRVHVYRPQDS
jgi:nephrocystin-4